MHLRCARKIPLALAVIASLSASLSLHAQTLNVSGQVPLEFNNDLVESLTLTGTASSSANDLIDFGGIQVQGDVTNDADLSASGDSNSAIDVDASSITGTFTNNGNLSSQGNPASALNFGMSSALGIVNNGTIHSSGAMNPDDDETVNGLLIWNSQIGTGGLYNHGQISAEGEHSHALKIESASIDEGLYNAGQIQASGSASRAISLLDGSSINSLLNTETGLISASGDSSRAVSISQGSIQPESSSLVNRGLIQTEGRASIGVYIDHPNNSILINQGQISSQGIGSRAISLNSNYPDAPATSEGLWLINTGTLQADGIAIETTPTPANYEGHTSWLQVDMWEGLISGGEAAIKGDDNILLVFDGGEIRGDLLGLRTMFASGDALFNGQLIQSQDLQVTSLELGQPHTRLEGNLRLGDNLDLNLHNQTDPSRAILQVNGDAVFGLFGLFGQSHIRLKPASEDFRGLPLREYVLISANSIEDHNSPFGMSLQVTSLSDLLQIESFEVTDTQVTAVVNALSGTQVSDYLRENGAPTYVLPAFTRFYGETLGNLSDADPLFQSIISSNDAELVRLAQQLAPEVNGAIGQVAAGNHNLLGNALQNRSASLRRGLSSGDGLSETGVWLQVLDSDADQGSRNGIAGYDADSQGIAVGADGKLNAQTTLGLAYSYLSSDVRSQNGNKTDIEGHTLTLYSGYEQDAWFADASLSYGLSDNQSKRYIAGTRAKGDYDSSLWGLNLLGGYGFDLGEGVLLEPRVAARYSSVQIESYREKGSSAALAVGEQRIEIAELGAGVRLAGNFSVGQGNLEPEAKLMAYHDFIADEASSTSAFVAGGTPFVTHGAKPARDSYEASLGLTYRLGAVSLGVSYDYLTKADYTADTVQAKVRYDF